METDRAAKKDFIGIRVLKNAASRLYRDDNGLFVYLKVKLASNDPNLT